MSYQLSLTLAQQPEVLERVLRVVRHRGFKVIKMDMQLDDEQGVRLAMHVESERAIELLTNQLDKLFDVIDCRVHA
ncbi:acetolactate synthase 2 small subunit [Shewanella violacea]|uniref:Acetolactate synthase II, small subunit n=1 Tax=Shewanella violacea (strain JCM 10179 / CIP 106290 / LMG 19151 / DSS12) TaxID=637905 RepID=D4ZCU3_SHEVD|nr:acetolactate synthase 2 small subunit [Shewanella violacea]BAJ03838.1 acetolactate synthase II, small subunit [Shewanella violacea DSS12]